MKRHPTFWVVSAVTVLLLALAFIACDDKKPTEPDLPPEPKDYPVYFYDGRLNEGNWYYVYHPLTNEIDSVHLPYSFWPVVSADGSLMYIRDAARNDMAVVVTDSFAVVDRLPYGMPIDVSPDSQLIAVQRSGLYILRTSDYSVVFHDSTLLGGCFSKKVCSNPMQFCMDSISVERAFNCVKRYIKHKKSKIH